MGSVLARPNIDKRDFDRVGTAAGRVLCGVLCWFSLSTSVGPADSTGAARASSTFRTPSRISSDVAPGGAVVVKVSVGRIRPSEVSWLSLAISSSVTRRSFSKRTSRPRLWQYHKTKRRTEEHHNQQTDSCIWWSVSLTEQCQGPEHIHAHNSRESSSQECHNGSQHSYQSSWLRHKFL